MQVTQTTPRHNTSACDVGQETLPTVVLDNNCLSVF